LNPPPPCRKISFPTPEASKIAGGREFADKSRSKESEEICHAPAHARQLGDSSGSKHCLVTLVPISQTDSNPPIQPFSIDFNPFQPSFFISRSQVHRPQPDPVVLLGEMAGMGGWATFRANGATFCIGQKKSVLRPIQVHGNLFGVLVLFQLRCIVIICE